MGPESLFLYVTESKMWVDLNTYDVEFPELLSFWISIWFGYFDSLGDQNKTLSARWPAALAIFLYIHNYIEWDDRNFVTN